MCEPVGERKVVCLVEAMIQASRKEIIMRVVMEQPAVRFKLIDQVRIESRLARSDKHSLNRVRVGIQSQQGLKTESACLGGQARHGSIGLVDARYHRITRQSLEPAKDRVLRRRRAEDIRIGEKRN